MALKYPKMAVAEAHQWRVLPSRTHRPCFISKGATRNRNFPKCQVWRPLSDHMCVPRCPCRSSPLPFRRRPLRHSRGLPPHAHAGNSREPSSSTSHIRPPSKPWWTGAAKVALGTAVLLAGGVLGAARPASASSGEATNPPRTTESMEGSFWGRGALTDSERAEAAAQRWQEASSSGTTAEGQSRQRGRGWHATGIELAFLGGGKKLETGKDYDMSDKEAHEFNRKNFGQPGMQYEDIFQPAKKPKKVNQLETQVVDPASFDSPEAKPVTAWRVDRLKKISYTQLWFLIKERKVKKVSFSRDYKTVKVTTTADAPGGERTEKVALPFDPDLYHHLVTHDIKIETPDPNMVLDTAVFGFIYLIWPILVAIAIFVGVLRLSFSPPEESDEEALFKGAKLDQVSKADKRTTFADIAGIDEVKAEMRELVAFLQNPKRFLDLGAKSPAGVLLVGNPGTGKTLLAKAIAGEAGVKFLSVAGTEFDQMYVGVGAARVRDMFRQARESSPCILFIDEFDGVGKQRSANTSDESANTINSLLTEMDGFEDNTGVIVIAATNRPNALDSALTRPGRFDRIIELPLPNIDGRIQILQVHARDKRMAPDADFHRVARATGGFSGAQLMNVMNVAAIAAVQRGAPAITTEDMFYALESIQREQFSGGSELYAEAPPPPNVRRPIAIYEAARAIVGTITPYYDEVSKVVCCPGGVVTGYTNFLPNEEQLESQVVNRAYMEAKMVVSLAGRTAERLLLGESKISTAGAKDVRVANLIAREMIYKCGFSKRLGPVALMGYSQGYLRGDGGEWVADLGSEIAAMAYADIVELVEGAEAKAAFGLVQNWEALKAVTQALMDAESISGDQLRSIMEVHGAQSFPDPFVEGFGWDENGDVVYPGSAAAGNDKVKVQEGEASVVERSLHLGAGQEVALKRRGSQSKIQDNSPPDLVDDELKILKRFGS